MITVCITSQTYNGSPRIRIPVRGPKTDKGRNYKNTSGIRNCLEEKRLLRELPEINRQPFSDKLVLNREWQKILMERAAS